MQPVPVPFTTLRVAVPFPGGAPVLFGLPNRPFTVLVIGLDRRPTETGASRTDTVLLLRIDPNAHKAAFLSIPRDTLMEIPDADGSFYQDRINTAFVYNYSDEDASAAPRATMATIEHNLGIKVDHYIIFDQRHAAGLIDAMGGVTIDNPRRVRAGRTTPTTTSTSCRSSSRSASSTSTATRRSRTGASAKVRRTSTASSASSASPRR